MCAGFRLQDALMGVGCGVETSKGEIVNWYCFLGVKGSSILYGPWFDVNKIKSLTRE